MGLRKNSDDINSVDKYSEVLKKIQKLNLVGPFRASHRYVDDRRGDTVLECSSEQVAKVMAELLNCLPNPDYLKGLIVVKEVIKEVEKEVKNPVINELTNEQKYKKLL